MSFEPLSFKTQPPAVRVLLAVHAAVYLLQWFPSSLVTGVLGLSPSQVMGALWLWQPVTYIFLHNIGVLGFFFFLIHMYILSTLGRDLEQRWGSAAFAFYYLACGVAGALVAVALVAAGLGRFAPPLMLGSSTALLGLLTAFATLAPGAQVVFYFMPMTARQLIWMVVVLEVLMAVANLVPKVEVAAQLAGMGVGFLLVSRRLLDTDWKRRLQDWKDRRHAAKHHIRVVNMENEVDRILDKVLKQGAGSLTRQEQELMQKYSKSKR